MKFRTKFPFRYALFALLIIVSMSEIVVAQWKQNRLFSIDTLVCVKYGNELDKLTRSPINPRLFRATNENIYVFQSDGSVLTYDKNGAFAERNKIPLKNPGNIMDIASNKDGLVLIDFYKIYYLNHQFKLIDSVDYPKNLTVGQQFCIHENVYLNNFDTIKPLIRFNINSRSFTAINRLSIWGPKSADCIVNPFPPISYLHAYEFAGASTKLIIACRYNDRMNGIHALFNTTKCTSWDLFGFDYDVFPTTNPWDHFQFIDDTTAIFYVRYFDKMGPFSEVLRAMKLSNGLVERDCVFYRIRFSTNFE
jgi:hypothetical protein